MKANYHTHTTRCQHAQGTEREYVQAALDGGFDVLGFADHAPWPYRSGFVSGIRMACDQLPDYIASLRALQEEYADRLPIYIGLECEYFPRYHDHLLRMRDQGVGYFILGQHYADSEEDTIYAGMDCRTDDGVRRYADATVKAIRTGLYRYVAHPDLFMRARYDEDFNAACEEASDMICQAAREQGMPIEYNLAGLVGRERDYSPDAAGQYGGRRGYPSPAFWQYARKWNNDAIIGVDAHEPGSLADVPLWERAKRDLTDMGYHLIDHLNMEG
ncbi:MAG: histidinol-phosphatase [Christensenellaceae bacterium]|nr:histidinol-phosphatase [Christensenellaceae bacterium]